MAGQQTPRERIYAALSRREPDRVPLLLRLTAHGARELGMALEDYLSSAESIAEGQFRMQERYGGDVYFNMAYPAFEAEAWGMAPVYGRGPLPMPAPPQVSNRDILRLVPPRPAEAPSLRRVLRAHRLLKERGRRAVPVMGTLLSPVSTAVMQLGAGRYAELSGHGDRLLDRLIEVNEAFAVDWAHAQLAAGADALVYTDCRGAPEGRADTSLGARLLSAARVFQRLRGVIAWEAPAPAAEVLSANTGARALCVSTGEDLSKAKRAASGRAAVIGNLDGQRMGSWSASEAEAAVKETMARAGRGGGFILSDGSGGIPLDVPEGVLYFIAEAARRWGAYPLEWVGKEAA